MSFHVTMSILLLMYFSNAWATLPNCAKGVTCPPGGLWGEWTTAGDGKCKMDCGSCAQLLQTRECYSSEVPGCGCIGDKSRTILCNMKTCSYPAQRACCIPYVPMVVNGSSICGPVPKTMKEPDTRCCPINGLWSDYTSGYIRVNNQWVRTRRCLSAAMGCPCIGEETEGSPSGFWRKYDYVSMLIMKEVGGKCTYDYPFYCTNSDRSGDESSPIYFSCDTDSGYWVYDFTGKKLESYVAGVYITVYK